MLRVCPAKGLSRAGWGLGLGLSGRVLQTFTCTQVCGRVLLERAGFPSEWVGLRQGLSFCTSNNFPVMLMWPEDRT